MSDIKAGQRLGEYLEKKGLTPYWLENELGLSNGRIKKSIERNSDIKANLAQSIKKVLPDLSIEWLLSGQGSWKSETIVSKSEDIEIETPITTTIPTKTFLEMSDDLRALNKEMQERLKNEIAYEREIRELRLQIKDLNNALRDKSA